MKVKAAMDKLMAGLPAEQKEETKLMLLYESEVDENEKMTNTKWEEKTDLDSKIVSFTKLVEKLTAEMEAARERTAATYVAAPLQTAPSMAACPQQQYSYPIARP